MLYVCKTKKSLMHAGLCVTEWAFRRELHVLEQITEHKCIHVYLYEREKGAEAQSGLFLALSLFTEGLNMR